MKCNDQAQPLDDAQIDLIILKQTHQLIAGMIGIVRAHSKGSRSEVQMLTRRDDLNELAINLSTAIAKARQLKLPTSVYILSMALVEVLQATKAAGDDSKDDAGE